MPLAWKKAHWFEARICSIIASSACWPERSEPIEARAARIAAETATHDVHFRLESARMRRGSASLGRARVAVWAMPGYRRDYGRPETRSRLLLEGNLGFVQFILDGPDQVGLYPPPLVGTGPDRDHPIDARHREPQGCDIDGEVGEDVRDSLGRSVKGLARLV